MTRLRSEKQKARRSIAEIAKRYGRFEMSGRKISCRTCSAHKMLDNVSIDWMARHGHVARFG